MGVWGAVSVGVHMRGVLPSMSVKCAHAHGLLRAAVSIYVQCVYGIWSMGCGVCEVSVGYACVHGMSGCRVCFGGDSSMFRIWEVSGSGVLHAGGVCVGGGWSRWGTVCLEE